MDEGGKWKREKGGVRERCIVAQGIWSCNVDIRLHAFVLKFIATGGKFGSGDGVVHIGCWQEQEARVIWKVICKGHYVRHIICVNLSLKPGLSQQIFCQCGEWGR